MSTTQPIRSREALNKLKNYYYLQKPNRRNNMLIILGLNTALRISDILQLKWDNVYNDAADSVRKHAEIHERKTGKINIIAINRTVCEALCDYRNYTFAENEYDSGQYLFQSQKGDNTPICRSQAYRIIKTAAEASGLTNHVSCHSLRKTFGYHAWKQGIQPALLMDIYNHSSYSITKRYLCIEQDEKDEVYLKISL